MIALSIVIPCFNEAQRLSKTLSEAFSYLESLGIPYECIFVDDGSTDTTVEHIHSLCGEYDKRYRIISLPTNRGKGGAIREGMRQAKGKLVFFMDADFSTPINTIVPAREALGNGADVVIASRRHPQSRLVVPQSPLRIFLGRGFTWCTTTFLGISVSDVTCGFKGFRNEAAQYLFEKQHRDDWSFDAEILFLATKRGLAIQEIPLVWTNRLGTKVHIVKDIVRSCIGLVAIRLNDLRGFYA